MKKPGDGMQMFHEQVNDRQKWHEAMERRKEIITELDSLKWIMPGDKNQMKMVDLEKTLLLAKSVRGKKRNEKHRVRRSKGNG